MDDFKFSSFSEDSPGSSSKPFSNTSGTTEVELTGVPISGKCLVFGELPRKIMRSLSFFDSGDHSFHKFLWLLRPLRV